MMSRSGFAVGVVALMTVVMTGLALKREFGSTERNRDIIGRHVDHFESLASVGHRTGAKEPQVTVVIFSDFQCPYCAGFEQRFAQARRDAGLRVAVVYRQFPLQMTHRFALDAARASECASDQDRFQAYHDTLFKWQDSLGRTPWSRIASASGVPDTVKFAGCMKTHVVDARIKADQAAAEQIGVEGTPTFVINGTLYQGSLTEPELVEQLLRAAK